MRSSPSPISPKYSLLDVQRAQGALEAALVAVRAGVQLGRVRDVHHVVGLLVVQPTHHDRLEEAAGFRVCSC